MEIIKANEKQYEAVRSFYHSLIDGMRNSQYDIGWVKDIYPAPEAIRLDVLGSNVPAEKLYTGLGFRYMDTLQMYYEDTGWTDYELYEYVLN